MKRKLPSICLLMLVPTLMGAGEVPRPSPEYAIKLATGSQSLLSEYRGKVVALMFFDTTCIHCQRTSKLIERLYPEYHSRGFQPIGVAFHRNAQTLVADFI